MVDRAGRPNLDRGDRGDPEAIGGRLEPLATLTIVVVPVATDQEVEVVERRS